MPLFQSSVLKKYSAAGFPASLEAGNKEWESCIYPADFGRIDTLKLYK